jgi:peroxiredoxin
VIAIIVLQSLFMVALACPDGPDQVGSADADFRRLSDNYEAASLAFHKAVAKAKTAEDLVAVQALPGRMPLLFANGFLNLARAHPRTEVAEDSLVWVASHVIFGREHEEAKRLLSRDHVGGRKLSPVFAFQYWSCGSKATETLLREVVAKNPHRDVRGLAHYWLARFLIQKAEMSRVAARGGRVLPPPGGIVDEGWGADYVSRLRALNPTALEAEAAELLIRVKTEYKDVIHNDKVRRPGPLIDAADAYLHELRDLAIGREAPEVNAVDLEGKPFRLSDQRGRVVVLIFGSHTYCGTCRALYPSHRELVTRFQGEPFTLLTIDADVSLESIKKAWKSESNNWRCVYDGQANGPIQTAWNIQEYPTIYVIDHKGINRYKNVTGAALKDAVYVLLKELREHADTASKPKTSADPHQS